MSKLDNSGYQHNILLESGTNEVEFLEFDVQDQRFGVNVGKVSQILVWNDVTCTPLPKSQPEILGTMYFRDMPISVVDLSHYLGLRRETEVGPERQLLIVMEFNRKFCGFRIDRVYQIHRTSWTNFDPVESSTSDETCTVGTVRVEDRVVVILDMEAIMGRIDPEMSMDSRATVLPQASNVDRGSIKILYCEDSPVVQKITLKLLKQAGFTNILTFSNGADGLEHLKGGRKGDFDIILSDIEMPQMDGLTLCKQVRSLPHHLETPFIFFSSMITPEMERKCQSVGGNEAMCKPELDEIVAVLERYGSGG